MRLPRWRPEEITFRLDDPMTEATVWTFTVFAPGCTLHVMVNAGTESEDRKVVTFSGVHMHGAAPNDIGVANLRAMGARFCEVTGYDELVVKGSDRTTGARPGRTPGHLRFKRDR